MPRELSPRERDLLDLLLSVDFPGVVELRHQAGAVTAEREGMIIDLIVPSECPVAPVVGRVPVQAVVDGGGYDGGIILLVDDGRLSALEYWWVTEDMPERLPPIDVVGRPVVTAAPSAEISETSRINRWRRRLTGLARRSR